MVTTGCLEETVGHLFSFFSLGQMGSWARPDLLDTSHESGDCLSPLEAVNTDG